MGSLDIRVHHPLSAVALEGRDLSWGRLPTGHDVPARRACVVGLQYERDEAQRVGVTDDEHAPSDTRVRVLDHEGTVRDDLLGVPGGDLAWVEVRAGQRVDDEFEDSTSANL